MAKKGKIKNKKNQVKDNIERPVRHRKYKAFFLIVCEDESTEPYYFQKFEQLFPQYTLFLKTVGTGLDPLGVVEQSIIERKKLYDLSKKEIDFVWAVFDKDDADENNTKIQRFEKAFNIAKEESVNIAYSNEVFELWLLLHLTNVNPNAPIPRKNIYHELEKVIGKHPNYEQYEYVHGNRNVVDIINKIGNEQQAINRAIDLLKFHGNKAPIEANPSTKVHLLVQELREWIHFYNWKPEK